MLTTRPGTRKAALLAGIHALRRIQADIGREDRALFEATVAAQKDKKEGAKEEVDPPNFVCLARMHICTPACTHTHTHFHLTQHPQGVQPQVRVCLSATTPRVKLTGLGCSCGSVCASCATSTSCPRLLGCSPRQVPRRCCHRQTCL